MSSEHSIEGDEGPAQTADLAMASVPVWSVDQIEALVDHLPVMIAYWDRSARSVFVNQSYVDWFGDRPLAQFRGMYARDLLGVESWVRALPYVRAVLAGQTLQYDIRLADGGGRVRHIQIVYIPNEVDGAVVGFYTLGIDVTERVTAHAVERESAEQVATFLERERIADELHSDVIQRLFAVVLDLEKPSGPRVGAAADAIQEVIGDLRSITVPARAQGPDAANRSAAQPWTATELITILDHMPAKLGFLDNDLRVRFVNRSGASYLRRSRAEIVGLRARELLDPEAYQRTVPHMRAAVAGQLQVFDRAFTDADGEIRQLRTTFIPHVVGDVVDGFFVHAVDVSKRVHAEAELRRSVERIADLEGRLQAAEAEVRALRAGPHDRS